MSTERFDRENGRTAIEHNAWYLTTGKAMYFSNCIYKYTQNVLSSCHEGKYCFGYQINRFDQNTDIVGKETLYRYNCDSLDLTRCIDFVARQQTKAVVKYQRL